MFEVDPARQNKCQDAQDQDSCIHPERVPRKPCNFIRIIFDIRVRQVKLTESALDLPVPIRGWAIPPSVKDAQTEPGQDGETDGCQMYAPGFS